MEKISLFGVALISFGGPLAAISFFVLSRTGITAFGLVCAILGGVLVLTPWNPVPEAPVKSMVEGAFINIEALLEEVDARGKAVYLPPNQKHVYAFVPLASDHKSLDLGGIEGAPRRIISEISGVSGLTVFPPGAEIVRSSNLTREMGLEASLHHVLVDFIEVVEEIQAVRDEAEIKIILSSPQIDTDHPRVKKSFGSLSVSLAACVLAYVLDEVVRVSDEKVKGNEIEAVFEVVS